MSDCKSYRKNVTVAILPDGTPNLDPICVAENGTVHWKCAGHAWQVEFEGGGQPVAGKGRFGGKAGEEDGGEVTATDGDRFKYTVVLQTEDGEKRLDPDMAVGPPRN